eukprot:ctg_2628.g778
MAESLLTLCSVLRERPRIRYARDSLTGEAAAVAQELVRVLDEYGSVVLPPPTGGEARLPPRTVLLILDRSCDIVTPLLHNRIYQAVLLQEFPELAGNGDGERDAATVLDEYGDESWEHVRHLSLEQVREATDATLRQRGDAGGWRRREADVEQGASTGAAGPLAIPLESSDARKHGRLVRSCLERWRATGLDA